MAQSDGVADIKTQPRKETEVTRVTCLFSGEVSFFSREEITKGRGARIGRNFLPSAVPATLARRKFANT